MKKKIETCYVDYVWDNEKMRTAFRLGVYVEKENGEDEKVSDDFNTSYLLCSGRCAEKSHYGTLYEMEDGRTVFVCDRFADDVREIAEMIVKEMEGDEE